MHQKGNSLCLCMAGSLENGDVAHLNEVERRQRELQSKQQQLLREQRTADQEKLLSCITGATLSHAACWWRPKGT